MAAETGAQQAVIMTGYGPHTVRRRALTHPK